MQQRRRTWRRAVLATACAIAFGTVGAPLAAAAQATPPAPSSTAPPDGAAPNGTPPDVAENSDPAGVAVGVSALVLGIGGFAFGLARRVRAGTRR